MNEFIKEGFNGASTNTIVKNAEISKGALFNYFENKENLYLYLIKENLNKLLENFQDRKELPKSLEFFEGLELFINANINFFTAHPNTFKFLANAITRYSTTVCSHDPYRTLVFRAGFQPSKC
jgi:AcrR family transcriptional regulator